MKSTRYIDAWEIDDQDILDMCTNYEIWSKKVNLNELEFYNGQIYFIVDNNDVVCEQCLKDNPDWISEIQFLCCNLENTDLYCNYCSERIAAQYGDN